MYRQVLLVTVMVAAASADQFVPFAIPLEPNLASSIWIRPAAPIQPNGPRLQVVNGQFWFDKGPIRLWGVNLSFAANFPTHDDARRLAERMAAAGVNAVRCHHMDTSVWPNGIWDQKEPIKLSSEALDRLDFFINQLATKGIFVNLNLHVGRSHSRYLGLPQPNTDYDKIVGIFTPALIDAQKQYAAQLLGHRNPYRANVRYADDPAIAIVEISNEDSLFMWSADQDLRSLPAYYANILKGLFNAYLRDRYGSNQVLLAAWSRDTEPLGADMLNNGTLADLAAGWRLEQHAGCKAGLANMTYQGQPCLQVKVLANDGIDWHLQLNQGQLGLKAGRYYTINLKAVAVRPRSIICNVGQDHDPWRGLGLWRRLDLGTAWQTFTMGFTATEDEQAARLNIAFGNDEATFYLADIHFRPGGQVALAPGEDLGLGTVGLFAPNESTARTIDRMIFLARTEKAYFDQMRRFIGQDLDCNALVTGTIVFGPLGLYGQLDMDFIDSHAYWQHPQFPRKPWDSSNWIVEQLAMTDLIDQATLPQLAAQRLVGKPYTVSEYNHPAPNDYQAECVPMIASFAAAQGWDGVWLYTYSHSNDQFDRQLLNSYFDVDTNPAKWGFMPAGAVILLGQGITRLGAIRSVNLVPAQDLLTGLAALHIRYDRDMLAAAQLMPQQTVAYCVQVSLDGGDSPAQIPPAYRSKIDWTIVDGQGVYYAYGPKAWVCVGHTERMADQTRGRVQLEAPKFAAVAMVALDDKILDQSCRILLTACGRCENVGMGFSSDRRTVGTNWGKAPVHIEAVSGQIAVPSGNWQCRALAPDGSAGEVVPFDQKDSRLRVSAKAKTMWYLLTR